MPSSPHEENDPQKPLKVHVYVQLTVKVFPTKLHAAVWATSEQLQLHGTCSLAAASSPCEPCSELLAASVQPPRPET